MFRCPQYLLDAVKRVVIRDGNLDLISEYIIVGLGGGFNVLSRFLKESIDVTGTAKTIKVYTGYYKDLKVTAIAMGGGPTYAEWITALAALRRAKALIGIGWCGALQEHINIGDIVLPIAAVRDENTTDHYVDKAFPAAANPHLYSIAKNVISKQIEHIGIKLWEGIIISTSAMLAETPEWTEKWRKNNILAVEEETSTLYVLGYLNNIPTLTLLDVSDNVVIGEPREYTQDIADRINKTYNLLIESALEDCI